MLKRTLTGVVILLITATFVFLKQFNSLFFDAFALIMIYASIIEVSNAYKKCGKKPYTAVLLCIPIIMFAAIYLFKQEHQKYEVMTFAILFSFILNSNIGLQDFHFSISSSVFLSVGLLKISSASAESSLIVVHTYTAFNDMTQRIITKSTREAIKEFIFSFPFVLF